MVEYQIVRAYNQLMVGWTIISTIALLLVWNIWSDARMRKKQQRFMGDDYPPELKKTSTFGSVFFCFAAGAFTVGVVAVISTIGRTLPQILDACVAGGLFFVPATICWYVGFRHDRPKLQKFYGQGKQDE